MELANTHIFHFTENSYQRPHPSASATMIFRLKVAAVFLIVSVTAQTNVDQVSTSPTPPRAPVVVTPTAPVAVPAPVLAIPTTTVVTTAPDTLVPSPPLDTPTEAPFSGDATKAPAGRDPISGGKGGKKGKGNLSDVEDGGVAAENRTKGMKGGKNDSSDKKGKHVKSYAKQPRLKVNKEMKEKKVKKSAKIESGNDEDYQEEESVKGQGDAKVDKKYKGMR